MRLLPGSNYLAICSAAVLACRPGSVISHISAARLYGIPLPHRWENSAIVDVSISADSHASRQRGIRGHRLLIDPHDIEWHEGVLVTSPARTWCDLAGLLCEEDLVAAGDYLLWRNQPQTTPEQLLDTATRHVGRRWRSRMLAAVPFLTDRSDSRPESIFRVRFARAGLPVPSVNLDLFDRYGRFIARPDLAFEEYREVFDYEGEHHRTDAGQWAKDLKRVPRLEQNGWHSTRAGKADLANSSEVIAQLSRVLRERGWNGR